MPGRWPAAILGRRAVSQRAVWTPGASGCKSALSLLIIIMNAHLLTKNHSMFWAHLANIDQLNVCFYHNSFNLTCFYLHFKVFSLDTSETSVFVDIFACNIIITINMLFRFKRNLPDFSSHTYRHKGNAL